MATRKPAPAEKPSSAVARVAGAPTTRTRVASFAPLATPAARLLILGSMPGVRSLAAHEYYAHPQNAFWKITGEVFGFDPKGSYPERVRHLMAAHVAVWDVLQSCERDGSLDTAIDAASAVPNDFAGFFERYPLVTLVCFNGGTAERYFQRQVLPGLQQRARAAPHELRYLRLPSTSPAHAGVPYVGKLAQWRAALSPGNL